MGEAFNFVINKLYCSWSAASLFLGFSVNIILYFNLEESLKTNSNLLTFEINLSVGL